MNNLLKYLLFLIAIVFSIGICAGSESTPEDDTTITYEVQMDVVSSYESPTFDFGICPSNSFNISSTCAELLRTLKKLENFKQTITFLKADKVINVGVRCSLQQSSINFHSVLSEPNYKLISLKKLVI